MATGAVGALRHLFQRDKCSSAQERNEEIPEEQVALLRPVTLLEKQPSRSLMSIANDSLNVFKGLLTILMTCAHVDLTLMPPVEQYYQSLPHFIGNAAASLCFLGFVLAYGFSCDNAYLSDHKQRTESERLGRMLRSALLPVGGAYCCAFAWGWICWKLPVDLPTLLQVLDFRLTLGNGPDFLLCFSICIVAMYPLRQLVNMSLRGGRLTCAFSAIVLLMGPLLFTKVIVKDCTGARKYFGYFLECTQREAFAPVLPALPHLFYFNMGLLLARGVRALDAEIKVGKKPSGTWVFAIGSGFCLVGLTLSYPLWTVWAYNFGNLAAPSQWGPITRGFTDGPSLLWLLGNVFPVFACLGFAICLQCFVDATSSSLARFALRELSNLGANVLLYLVVADICLAGLYRGQYGQFPLHQQGCLVMTGGVLCIGRFLQYMVSSK